MFVPLSHPPGHGQADFGEAMVVIGGVERKAHFFVLDLPHSDGCYVRAYPAAVSGAWVDGHIHAFAFFGAVPESIVYDNDRCLVAKILPDGTRNEIRIQRLKDKLGNRSNASNDGSPSTGCRSQDSRRPGSAKSRPAAVSLPPKHARPTRMHACQLMTALSYRPVRL